MIRTSLFKVPSAINIWSPARVFERCISRRALGGSYRRFASEKNNKSRRKITDEGIIIYESDPTTTNESSLGLVWGSIVWPSGVSLAKYFAANEQSSLMLSEKRVLELGCGTAIVGLTVAKLGAQHVTLTDSESSLWPILRKSIKANHLQEHVEIKLLDWRQPPTFLNPNEYDLILAADVLYSGMDKLFARVLASHLKIGTDAFLACPYRKDSPLADFLDVGIRLGLEFERLEDKHGAAVGGIMGMDASEIYRSSHFVALDSVERREMVATEPTFSSLNEEKVQIFRVQRVSGTPEEAAKIRRVGRM